jgi:hypothetical protein
MNASEAVLEVGYRASAISAKPSVSRKVNHRASGCAADDVTDIIGSV